MHVQNQATDRPKVTELGAMNGPSSSRGEMRSPVVRIGHRDDVAPHMEHELNWQERRWQPTDSEREANMPRGQCTERVLAICMGLICLTVTMVIIVAIVVPVVCRVAIWTVSYSLATLAAVAILISAYMLQIGLGAYFWTKRYQVVKDMDWYHEWRQARERASESRPNSVFEWEQVQHYVFVTAYKEPIDVMKLMLWTLVMQRGPDDFCRQQINLVLAMEEREGAAAQSKAELLRTELGPYFRSMLVTFHPPDLAGDIKGKASNFKWAVMKAEAIIRGEARSEGIHEDHCLVHVADADSLYDPNHFSNVTYDFCVMPDRYELVFEPCMISTCNLWEVPPPVRQTNLVIAAQEMMSAWDALEFQIPFSTYGMALRTLQRIGGTGQAGDAQDGDVIAEDHHLFIKGALALDGHLRVHPIFLPCLNFSVGGDDQSCMRNMHDRYVQAKRHMFGVSELMYLVGKLANGHFCCGRRRLDCRKRWWIGWLSFKLVKVHLVPYLGLWLTLGLILYGLLSINKTSCLSHMERLKRHLCEETLTPTTESIGFVIFSLSTTCTFIGGVFTLLSFTRMLHATQHTLTNIGDPNGSFMPPAQDEVFLRPGERARRVRRPIRIGYGFPWFGTMLQLFLEFVVFGFVTSVIFGSLPAIISLWHLIRTGHRMEYVTAPKPGSATARGVPAPPGSTQAEGAAGAPSGSAADVEVAAGLALASD
mmetsp:Transcript_66953/g.143164  ORF Transcript_66953/g.143164 Transcript_66953/m.143164 type:complete len:707 (+) Transcript_66953:94-2214(+)